jgi:SM-20-related protein
MRTGTARVTPDFALSDAEIHALDEQGWFLRDAVLGRRAAMDVHDAVEALAAAGRLRPAGLSRGATHRVDTAVRGDAIAWVAPDEVSPELAALRAAFFGLRDALNREAYLGLDRMEIQVARYPGGGAAYSRHRDAFPAPPGGRPNRRVTAIYYANPGWRPEDGGALRLHVAERSAERAIDVAPVLDRLLVFLSERVEHEVLPARAPRRAVTAWFRARDPLGG